MLPRNKTNNLFIKFLRNIPVFAIVNLVLVLVCSFVINMNIILVKEDIYQEEMLSKSKLYQTFLDSASGKLEKEIYFNLTNKGVITCSENDIKNLNEVRSDLINSLNEISDNLQLYSFTLDKDKTNDVYLKIMVNNKLMYNVIEFEEKYVLIDIEKHNTLYKDKDIFEVIDNESKTKLIKSKYMIENHPILDSHLINKIKSSIPTDFDVGNTYNYNDKQYYYNISILPRYAYFEDLDHDFNRKIGFIAIYNEDYINESINESIKRIDRIGNIIGGSIIVTSTVSILLIVYSAILDNEARKKQGRKNK